MPTLGRPMIAILTSGASGSGFAFGNFFGQRIEQHVNAEPVFRGNRENFVAEFVKLRGEVDGLLRRVHFIYGENRRLARAAQQIGEFLIERRRAGAAVHHLHHARRIFNRDARLPQNFAGDSGFVFRNDSAGVHHFEAAAFPVARCRRCGRA